MTKRFYVLLMGSIFAANAVMWFLVWTHTGKLSALPGTPTYRQSVDHPTQRGRKLYIPTTNPFPGQWNYRTVGQDAVLVINPNGKRFLRIRCLPTDDCIRKDFPLR